MADPAATPPGRSWRHWLMVRIAARDSSRPCVADESGIRTCGDIAAEVARARDHIDACGIGPGDAVSLRTGHSPAAVAWLLALLECRAIAVPSSVPAEHAVREETARARWRIRFDEDPSGRPEAIPSAPDAPVPALYAELAARGHAGLVLFSSGTAGTPKAMVHDLDTLVAPLGQRRDRALVFVILLLFDHIGGLNTLFNCLASGSLALLPASTDPDAVAALAARHRASVLPASPTFLNLLLLSGAHLRHDLSSLRIATYGTEPMPAALLDRLRGTFPRVRFLQTFGTSETGIARTTSPEAASTLLRFDDPGTEWKIVNGELWLRSATRILGYLNHTMNAFTADGWFRTGDLAEDAGDGRIRILGRRSEVINVGGRKVLPAEVESFLLRLPYVAACNVYAVPNPVTGQAVGADILPAPGTPPDATALKLRIRADARDRIDPFKIPARVRIADAAAASARLKKAAPPTNR